MISLMSSCPERHPDIPESAEWVPSRKEFREGPVVDGRPHGRMRWFRPDGTMSCESGMEHGTSHGPYVRYHPNGEVSQSGAMKQGQREGLVTWTRSTGETTEGTVPPQCPENVWKMTAFYEGGIPGPIRFFDRDDREVLHTGERLPDRPATVDERAAFDPVENRWFFGMGSQGYEQRDGWWAWWDPSGRLLLKMHYAHGQLDRKVEYAKDGSSVTRIVDRFQRDVALVHRDEKGEVVTPAGERLPEPPVDDEGAVLTGRRDPAWVAGPQLHQPGPPDGLWRWWTPAGVLAREQRFDGGVAVEERWYDTQGKLTLVQYKDLAGRSIRSSRWSPSGRLVTSVGEPIPARPEGVSSDAQFDTESEQWVEGEGIDGGAPEGLWRWTDPDGTVAQERIYEGAKAIVERRYHSNGNLFVERKQDSQGRPLRKAYFFSDGDLNHAIETTYDGGVVATVEIRTHEHGLRSRGERVDGGLSWRFFDRDGELEAEGTVDDDDHAIGSWRFVHDGSSYEVDMGAHRLSARVDERFSPTSLLGAALLPAERDHPVPEALAGVEEVDWSSVPSCYGETDDFALDLRGLLSDVPAVRRTALRNVYAETLHQGTVYVATARAIPFMVRALEHPNADVREILEHFLEVASNASIYREQAEEWDADDDERTAILGTLDAIDRGFESILEVTRDSDDELTKVVLALAEYVGDAGRAFLLEAANTGDPEMQAIAAHTALARSDWAAAEAEALLEHDRALVRCCAAVSVARHGDQAPGATVDVLVESLEAIDQLAPRFDRLPFATGPLVVYVALGLGNICTQRAQAEVKTLLQHVDGVPIDTLPALYRALFALCFRNGTRPFADDFIDVLDYVSKDSRLDGFVNFFDVSDRWSLPRDRRAYREMVDALRASDDPGGWMIAHHFQRD